MRRKVIWIIACIATFLATLLTVFFFNINFSIDVEEVRPPLTFDDIVSGFEVGIVFALIIFCFIVFWYWVITLVRYYRHTPRE